MAEGQKRKKIILASLEAQACRTKRTTKGYMIYFPNGDMATMHLTDSDYRAEKNMRARVLRAGLSWPFDGDNRK